MDVDAGLVGYWKLAGDCRDSSGLSNHGVNHGVALSAPGPDGDAGVAALFDGRGAFVEIPASPSLRLGSAGLAVSLWAHTGASLDDAPGDLLSKFDPARRMGFTFGIRTNSCVSSLANERHLHFGIDNSLVDSAWTDRGRPGNAIFVTAMCVREGHLYVGTCEAGAGERGHVFRLDGADGWIDCGLPTPANAVMSLGTYRGQLYAADSSYDPRYSLMDGAINMTPGGRVYRYESDGTWTDCGRPGGDETTSASGLIVYRDALYAKSNRGLYRYDGGQTWSSCGPGGGVLAVYNGHLFGNGGKAGAQNQPVTAMYRYDGGSTWTPCGETADAIQIYSICAYEGQLYIGTWPTGTVYRWDGGDSWTDCGRLGNELEVMGLMVYNGKLYGGTLPRAEVYRYDGGTTWTRTGQLDATPGVQYRRAWSMAVYKGMLFCGTLPSGHVYSLEAGRNVTYDHALGAGWKHLAAVKEGVYWDCRLKLYVDGELVAESDPFLDAEVYISNDKPLRIGAGPQEFFHGRLREVRLYNRALTASEVAALYRAGR